MENPSKYELSSFGKGLRSCFGCLFNLCTLGANKRIITQGEIGLWLRNGKYHKKVGPGIYLPNPISDEFITTSIKTSVKINIKKILTLQNQDMLTKEGISLKVSTYLQYRIEHPETAEFGIDRLLDLLRGKALATMREVISSLTLNQVLHDRLLAKGMILERMRPVSILAGIKVERLEIDTIKLPHSLEMGLAADKLSEVESKANIVNAESNLASATKIGAAGKILNENSLSLQLQYLEVLKHLGNEKDTVLILPDSLLKRKY